MSSYSSQDEPIKYRSLRAFPRFLSPFARFPCLYNFILVFLFSGAFSYHPQFCLFSAAVAIASVRCIADSFLLECAVGFTFGMCDILLLAFHGGKTSFSSFLSSVREMDSSLVASDILK
jgi:hypothetical protein